MKRKLFMLRLMLCRSAGSRADYLKKKKFFKKQGDHCFIVPYNFGTEPHLISLGNNVVVSSNVTFITHDITSEIFAYMEPESRFEKRVGTIEVGDNVFIGAKSIILYDVKVGNNVIIAAGSVVTHDIPDGCIYGGVPARKIGDFEEYLKKSRK